MKNFVAGMNKDVDLPNQPQGSYRDALNMNLKYSSGSVVTEGGTFVIPAMKDKQVIGSVTLDNDNIVFFTITTTVDDEFEIVTEVYEIVLFKPNDNSVLNLYQNNGLNFKATHPIVATYRKNQANDVLIYFTDGYINEVADPSTETGTYIEAHNPPRTMNITQQEISRNAGLSSEILYSNPLNSVHKLQISPRIGKHTTIDSAQIESGGALLTGAYYLALAYADTDGLETNYFVVSNPVYITDGSENSVPTSSFVGVQGGTATNKLIKWNITLPETFSGNLNSDYSLLQASVIQQIDNSTAVYKMSPKTLSLIGPQNVVFTGLEDTSSLDVTDIIVDDVEYIAAQAISQLDNRLYLGNLRTNKDIGYQPFANNIKLEAKIEKHLKFSPEVYDTVILNKGYSILFQDFDSSIGKQYIPEHTENGNNWDVNQSGGTVLNSYLNLLESFQQNQSGNSRKGYRDPAFNFKKKSYRRGEVYAFYISFVLNDGTETYAYHIPGRRCEEIYNTGNRTHYSALGMDKSFDPEDVVLKECDLLAKHNASVHFESTGLHRGELLASNPNLFVYQVADTHNAAEKTTGFWENRNEKYPVSEDFKGKDLTSEGVIFINPELDIALENVRHHKMPSNADPAFSYIKTVGGTNSEGSSEDVQVYESGRRFLPEAIRNENGSAINTAMNLAGNNEFMATDEEIRTLGIQLDNVKIPPHLLNKVQGYKVYYAKRGQEDKTILGQSLAIPGHPRYASVAQQSLAIARKGPYHKSFYLYGGLDHTDDSAIDIVSSWLPTTNNPGRYYGNPVFTFHDFNMLRKTPTLTSATHIQGVYGVMFRHYMGGPGIFVPRCEYKDLLNTPTQETYSNFNNYNDLADQRRRASQESTTFPSLGWVSVGMGNTTDYFYADIRDNSITSITQGSVADDAPGKNYVLDITDDFNFGGEDVDLGKLKRGKGTIEDLDNIQPNFEYNGSVNGDLEKNIIDTEAKAAKVRAWFTSVMIGSAYICPSIVLGEQSIIKGGDYKQGSISSPGTYNGWLNRFWGTGQFKSNQAINLVIEPKGASYVPGRSIFSSGNPAAFKGAKYLFNEAGETCMAFSLVSGLPHLRGHIPGIINAEGNDRAGLTRWGEGNRWLYPDAAIDGVPNAYKRMGDSVEAEDYATSVATQANPEFFRGLNYSLSAGRRDMGLPMSWLVNICATKTDVFNPFDQQKLVWTGYFHKIQFEDAEHLEEGVSTSPDGETNDHYFKGASSNIIYGGDTYISRYTFRTTSQSYGHSYFRASSFKRDPIFRDLIDDNPSTLGDFIGGAIAGNGHRKGAFQGDIPTNLNPLSGEFGTSGGFPIWDITTDGFNNFDFDESSQVSDAISLKSKMFDVVNNTLNWVKGNVNPVSTLFSVIVESDDLLEFRHSEDSVKGESTKFFGLHSASEVLFNTPENDYTKSDKLLYMDHYSALQTKKVAVPLPINARLAKVDKFPTRIARSNVDSGSLADGFRKFLALEYKDIPSDKGAIKALFSLSSTLYINSERALYQTTGNEELSVSATTAFIGSGNIFGISPKELMSSDIGYGGTTSRHAHITTHFGHFYINYKDKSIYKVSGEGLEDITMAGMYKWFRTNMPYVLETFGVDFTTEESNNAGFFLDAPMQTYALGFTLGYDPVYKRILVTKREPVPTPFFISEFYAGNIEIREGIPHIAGEDCEDLDPTDGFDDGKRSGDLDPGGLEVFCGPIGYGNPKYFTQGGWTLSYYPELKIWGSRHSYLPGYYMNTSQKMYSHGSGFTTTEKPESILTIWEHDNLLAPGLFYGQLNNSELEFIENSEPSVPKIFSNIFYWADSTKINRTYTDQTDRITDPAFSSYYVYNSTQISGIPTSINYLTNARMRDRIWYINNFRDATKYIDIIEGNLVSSTNPNVTGNFTSSVTSNIQTEPMFTKEGTVNAEYVDVQKPWYMKKKLIDHFMGVRLITDNSQGNLVHLYAAGTSFRKSNR